MGRKGKTQKHTAKEIASKAKAARERNGAAGGGGSGAAARKASTMKTMLTCSICRTAQPSVKSMAIHYDSKHPKENWKEAETQYLSEKQKLKNATKVKVQTHNAGNLIAKSKKPQNKGSTPKERAKKKAALAAKLSALGAGGCVKKKKKKSAFGAKKKK